ncbi:dephospho-CoA kinase [Arthrobacter psychrolactophilus]
MLSLGLTGGIAAGKSLLANRFRELGAVVIDADQLARDVVALGTPGLAAIVERFGPEILLADGTLNRPALGALVFADGEARQTLNAIVHPRVRAAAAELKRGADPDAIVVQDIPLLVESGQGANFHLVVVVQAPLETRVSRMVSHRGMSRDEALSRISAQASDAERAAVADVLIINDGVAEQAMAELDALWHERLLPFAVNLKAQQAATQHGELSLPGEGSEAAGERLARRLGKVVEPFDVTLSQIVGGAAPLEYQLNLKNGRDRAAIMQALGTAGWFPRSSGPAMLLASADPAVQATVTLLEVS